MEKMAATREEQASCIRDWQDRRAAASYHKHSTFQSPHHSKPSPYACPLPCSLPGLTHLPVISPSLHTINLRSPTLHNRRRAVLVLDRATARAASLDTLDDPLRLCIAVRDLAEDDVAAVEPGGDDGGDEELRAVGVGAGVGHAEHEGLLVREFEVLVRELLAVDGFAAGALGVFSC